MKLASALLGTLFFVGACGVGDDDGGPPGNFEKPSCTTNLALTGSYTMSMPPPDTTHIDPNTGERVDGPDGMPDIEGCWPTGNWTFTARITDGDCTPAPSVPTSFAFDVTFVNDPTEPTYNYQLKSPTTGTMHAIVKHSEGGGGLCEGSLELFSDDGKETYNLHPVLNVFNMNGPLEGAGTFERWPTSQVPTSGGS